MACSRAAVTALLLVLTRMLVTSHGQVISALETTQPPDDFSQATPGSDCTVDSYGLTKPVHASHGDVMLTDTNLVLICINSQWGTLDGKGDTGPTVPDTLCRQLGYEDGSATFERSTKYDEFFTLWLQSIRCPVDYQSKHIMRCNFTLNSDDFVDRSHEIHLRCSSHSTRNLENEENTYIGQVALVPPDDMLSLNLSRSWGLITIKHYSWRWDYIGYGLLTLSDADTICREMGYTHSVINTLQTIKSLLYQESQSFELNAFGRISSSNFNCLRSCQCAGCCFNVTIHDDKVYTFTSDLSALVIECAFYSPVSPSTPPVTGGYREICEASPEDGSIKDKDVCPRRISTKKTVSLDLFRGSMISFSIIVIGLIILVSITIVLIIYYKRKLKKRLQNGYEPIPRGGMQEREQVVLEREGVVQGREGVVQEREGAVQEREGAVQEREGAVQEQEGVLQEREGAVQGREGAVQEREGAVQEQEGVLQEREGAVQGREGAVQGREGAVQEREGAVQEQEQAVQVQEREVQGREQAVQGREQAVQEREQAVQEQERAAEGGENEH